MIEESDSGEQSSDELKEQVKSLEEKLAKQQKLTEPIRKDRKKKSMTVTTLLAVILGAFEPTELFFNNFFCTGSVKLFGSSSNFQIFI